MNFSRRRLLWGVPVLVGAVATALWWRERQKILRVSPSLLIAGASTMLALNRALLDAFAKQHPEIQTVLESGGSLAGLIALKRGAIDVAAMSRELQDEEDSARVHAFLIAKNEISIAVHPSSPLKNLSRAQISDVFSGKISNWQLLGGANAPIRVMSRNEGSSSRKFLQDVVLAGEDIALTAQSFESAAQLAQAVAADANAIGYVALKDRTAAAVKYLSVDDVPANRSTVLSGRYPLSQPLYLGLYGDDNPAARSFVAFARSPQGQAIVAAAQLIPVT